MSPTTFTLLNPVKLYYLHLWLSKIGCRWLSHCSVFAAVPLLNLCCLWWPYPRSWDSSHQCWSLLLLQAPAPNCPSDTSLTKATLPSSPSILSSSKSSQESRNFLGRPHPSCLVQQQVLLVLSECISNPSTSPFTSSFTSLLRATRISCLFYKSPSPVWPLFNHFLRSHQGIF